MITHPSKNDSFLHGMVLFNWNDAIRKSGHVTELCINFAKAPQFEHLPKVFLYILSTTKDKDQFVIIHRHEISNEQVRQFLSTKQQKPLAVSQTLEYTKNSNVGYSLS